MSRPELKLSLNLERLVKEKGLTYRNLSRKTGVSTSTLFNWSSGAIPRNLSDLQVVAKFLEVGLSHLLFGISEPEAGNRLQIRNNRLKGSCEIILDEEGEDLGELRSP